jgi:hypothetical protein
MALSGGVAKAFFVWSQHAASTSDIQGRNEPTLYGSLTVFMPWACGEAIALRTDADWS